MRPLPLFLVLLMLAVAGRADDEYVPFAALGPKPMMLKYSPVNRGRAEAAVSVAAGTIWETEGKQRFIALCPVSVSGMAPGSRPTVTLPAAALAAGNVWKADEPLARVREADARLEPFIAYIAKHPDLPRETSQLVVLALAGNLGFADWQKYIGAIRGQPEAPDSDVTTALDALTILRQVAPAGEFALASDAGLKLRALHNPLLRARALQLYGLVIPGDAPPGAVAPDLGSLLHTKPGDNCPICRMREQMQKPAEIP